MNRRFTIIVALLVVIFVGLAGYFTFIQKPESFIPNQVTNTTAPNTTSPSPSPTNVVKVSEPESERGVSIKGYFFRKNTTDWGDVPVTCDTLVVTSINGGDRSLIGEFIQWVKDGNAVNALDEKSGNLILNLDLDELSQTEKQKILSSTPQNTVELKVINTRSDGRGVPACYSFVQILEVD